MPGNGQLTPEDINNTSRQRGAGEPAQSAPAGAKARGVRPNTAHALNNVPFTDPALEAYRQQMTASAGAPAPAAGGDRAAAVGSSGSVGIGRAGQGVARVRAHERQQWEVTRKQRAIAPGVAAATEPAFLRSPGLERTSGGHAVGGATADRSEHGSGSTGGGGDRDALRTRWRNGAAGRNESVRRTGERHTLGLCRNPVSHVADARWNHREDRGGRDEPELRTAEGPGDRKEPRQAVPGARANGRGDGSGLCGRTSGWTDGSDRQEHPRCGTASLRTSAWRASRKS